MSKAEGVEVFSRMLIATVEYSNDECSPVFGLMCLASLLHVLTAGINF